MGAFRAHVAATRASQAVAVALVAGFLASRADAAEVPAAAEAPPDTVPADVVTDAPADAVPADAEAGVLGGVPASVDPGLADLPSYHPEGWEPQGRVVYKSFTAIRYNPLGLLERLQFGYRKRLFTNDGALYKGAWIEAGTEINLAPTYAAAGARLEIRPLSILGFAATYEFIGYFGVLGAVMPVGSLQDDTGETNLGVRGDAGENYATLGSRLTLSGVLQGKYKALIIRNQASALRVDLDLRDGDTLMYDATQDLVLEDGGWAMLNDLDVGAKHKKLVVGARYSYADALHGTGGPGDLPTHRVGPLVAYTFHDRPAGARFDEPTLLVLAQWHAQHPYRTGVESHPAIPLIAIALQFQGDLWVSRK